MATTTPNYGWDVPTSTDYVKDGATAIETLGDDIDATLYTALGGAYPGLRLVKKQTIGSAVASVNVTSAFSATYTNYLIIISGGAASVTNTLYLKMGSTADAHYGALIYAQFNGVVLGSGCNNLPTWNNNGHGRTSGLHFNTIVRNPFLPQNTTCQSIYFDASANSGTFTGLMDNQTVYTDFTIATSTGTMTGGTIYVYGFGIS